MLRISVDLHPYGSKAGTALLEASVINIGTTPTPDTGDYRVEWRMYYEGRARSGELTINGYNRLRPVAYLVEAVCDAIIDAWNEYGDATG